MKSNILVALLILAPITTFAGLKENIEAECSIEKGLVDEWKGWRFTPTSKGKKAYEDAKEAYDACVASVTERFKASVSEEDEKVGNEQSCAVKKLRGEDCD